MNLLKNNLISTALKNDMNITLITLIKDGIYKLVNSNNTLNQLKQLEQYRPFIKNMNSMEWDQLFKM